MTLIKDWMTETAEALSKEIGDHDNYTPDVLRPIIAEHFPYKDFTEGVAYMPVPRCDTCTHWTSRVKYFGWCGMKRVKLDTQPGATLLTASDFGCVQWERKHD